MKTKQTHHVNEMNGADATALFQKVSVATGLALLASTVAQASTDYGPAIWRPLCNANYYTTGSGHKFHVIHDMEGYYASVINWFDNCTMTSASIHYAVNGKKDATSDAPAGEITQLGVRDSQYAWHARCWNQHSTGTEHEGFASNPAWYTDAMYQASAGITRNLSAKFGWAKDRNHVIGHDQKRIAGWPSYASANLGIDPNCNSHTDPGLSWDWNKYMGYVNNVVDMRPGPDADSRYAGNVELFVRTADNHLKGKYYDSATGWSGWNDHAANCSSDPSVVSWDRDNLSVFYRGTDGALWVKGWSTAGGWGTPISLGGALIGGPDGCSMRAGNIEIFCRGTDNTLQHKSYNGSWGPWESLGGVLTSDPSAVSWGDGRIDVFVRDTAGALNQKFWTSTGGWSGWNQIGGALIGSPDACSMRAGRLDVFVRGTNNELHHISWQNGWSGWESLGGVMASDPGCTSWADGRIDVFLRGTDNLIDQKTWTSTGGWSGWIGLGIP